MGEWRVVTKAEGKNPGPLPGRVKQAAQAVAATVRRGGNEPGVDNVGGIIVLLTNGSAEQEVSRVAWVRRASENPEVTFKDQLDREIQKANEAAATLNEVAATQGSLA